MTLNVTNLPIKFLFGTQTGTHWEVTSNICRKRRASFPYKSLFSRRRSNLPYLRSRMFLRRKCKVNLTISLTDTCDFIVRIV